MAKQDKTYNGHKNWNHWNVALWISNDQGLYGLAMSCLRDTATLSAATAAFLDALQADAPDWKVAHTNDGAKFTKSAVYAALRGLKQE